MNEIQIRPFEPDDQAVVRDLILAGLGDHFEVIDPAFNPDLDDIAGYYVAHGASFLVAVEAEVIVGTGALIKEAEGVGRIVRMSVAAGCRRRGIGRLLVEALLEQEHAAGYNTIVVETNDDWYGAIRLYEQCGFRSYDHRDGEIHMRLPLGRSIP